MPKSSPAKLAYQKKRNAEPSEIKKREANNRARYQAIKEGKVDVGSKKDVDHIVPLSKGGTNDPKNLRVVSQKTNRGWRKGLHGEGPAGYDPSKQKK